MPVLVYPDQNFLINLSQEDGIYHESIRKLAQDGRLSVVMSPWHWVELAWMRDDADLLALAELVETFNPVWLFERRQLQAREVQTEFFRWLGIQNGSLGPFGSLSEVAAELAGVRVRSGDSYRVRQFAESIRRKPEAILTALRENVNARPTVSRALKKGRMTPTTRQRILKEYVRPLMPGRTPSGIIVGDAARRDFLEQIERDRFPTIATEFAYSEDSVKTGESLTRRSFFDRQHAMPTLPYVDYIITNDSKLGKRIGRVRSRVPFRTAEAISKEKFESLFGAGAPESPE